jgi:hypothetical protein
MDCPFRQLGLDAMASEAEIRRKKPGPARDRALAIVRAGEKAYQRMRQEELDSTLDAGDDEHERYMKRIERERQRAMKKPAVNRGETKKAEEKENKPKTRSRAEQPAQERECVKEFLAHARGEEPGLHRLRRVYRSILAEYNVPFERLDDLLGKAGLFAELKTGEIIKYSTRFAQR